MTRLASLLFCWGLTAGAFAADRPDIVLIMSDDMGFSDIGCYGGEIGTPNLDRLAEGGLRFSQFYNAGRCCPTRASLLTGLYPHQAGVGHLTDDYELPGYRGGLGKECRTIAEVLRTAGYATYMAGKWHVTRHVSKDGPKDNWPEQRGFDRFYGTITGAGSFYDPVTLCRGNTFITPSNDPDYQPEQFYYTDAISDNMVAFIRDHCAKQADKPFFAYVSYTAAHWPMHALPKDIEKYEGKYTRGYHEVRKERIGRLRELGLLDNVHDIERIDSDWSKVRDEYHEAALMEVYAAMITNMDAGIGRIVAELRRHDRLDNTLVLFLQDNGGCAEDLEWAEMDAEASYEPLRRDELQTEVWPPMQTREGRVVRTGGGVVPGPEDTYLAYGQPWANVSNTPFREYKHYVHEGGIATPLVAHWPEGITETGEWEHAPAHLIDIMATVADLAGAEYPREHEGIAMTPLEGISLRPSFEGGRLRRSKPLFWEHEGNRAVRDGKWKLVSKGRKGKWELYNMEVDRGEMNDAATAMPRQVKKLSAAYKEWAERCRVVPFGSWKRGR